MAPPPPLPSTSHLSSLPHGRVSPTAIPSGESQRNMSSHGVIPPLSSSSATPLRRFTCVHGTHSPSLLPRRWRTLLISCISFHPRLSQGLGSFITGFSLLPGQHGTLT